jgi:hypothetical protein
LSRTAIQTIRCLNLGSYRAVVVDGRLRVRGPLPMAPNLQESVMQNRHDIVAILEEYCGGAWPPLEGSARPGSEEGALMVLEVQRQAGDAA